jgi:arabinose-5-phosphate isomerase
MGKSGMVARKISGTLSSVGLPSFYIHPAEGLHGDLGALGRGDVLMVVSHSGRTAEVEAFLSSTKRLRLPVVALTGNPDSPLAERADVQLDVSVRREADRLNLAPTASTAAAMALGDALALAAAGSRGYSAKGFAARHPGGALGDRLRSPVGELARRGKKVGWVSPSDRLARVARAISAHRVGAVLVRGGGKGRAGIIVDGDLRRALARGREGSLTAGDIASPRPLSVRESASVSEALQLMEDRAVYQLLVVDAKGRVRGLVHIHDLLGRGRVRLSA